MRFCRECGIALAYGRYLEWTPDGTILGRDVLRARLVFLEVDEIRSLFSGVCEHIGLSIDPIVYRAEKEVGRRFVNALVPPLITRVPRTRFTRPRWSVRLASRPIFNYMAAMGMGRARIEQYHSGHSTIFRLVDVHSVALVVGDGAGVFEYLERVVADVSWKEEKKGRFLVTLEKAGGVPPGEKRLELEKPLYLPGSVRFKYCPRCGMPRQLTDNLSWDLDRGIVSNRITGAREVVMPTQSFFAVFRELTSELGEEIPSLLEGLEQDYMRESSGVRRYLDERGEVLDLFSDFPWRGMGNPRKADETEHGMEVVVENPFHPGMVAGRVAGLYEAWTGGRVRATWDEDRRGRLKVTMGKIS